MTTYLITGVDRGLGASLVAAGILDITAKLTLAETGKLFRFSGEERDF
ncbi:hypothetical protein [Yoonia algicola]|uniref:Uncharacterized protein n=1 Tax=Yoonia algicola TaxID=3137368 RepID=A0AAN0NHE3_9RHOB